MQSLIDFPVRRSPRNSVLVKSSNKDIKIVIDKVKINTPEKIHRASPRRRALDFNSFEKEEKTKSVKKLELIALSSDQEDEEENSVSPKKRNKKESKKIKNVETPTKKFTQHQQAKQLLSTAINFDLVTRENECLEIKSIIDSCLKEKKSTSIYLSGPPGTGKTASINYVLNELKLVEKFKLIFLNGMNFRTPNSFYTQIAEEFNCLPSNKQTAIDCVENEIKKTKKKLVIVLDEIDNLNDKHQEILYRVFSWPQLNSKNVIVIGIANTLDFTSRTLTRFHSLKLKPVKEIFFSPYTKEQIIKIIETRLNKLSSQEIINPIALQLIARKVSSQSGDIRKALNLCQRAIELSEIENTIRLTPLKLSNDDRCNEKKSNDNLNTPSKMVDINHVVNVLNQLDSSETSKGSCNSLDYLPMQQQMILLICLMYSKYRKQKQIEISKCYQLFVKLCTIKKLSYDVSNSSDFRSMCSLLEAKGFINIKMNTKDLNCSKISLNIDENEITHFLTTKSVFQSILNDSTFI